MAMSQTTFEFDASSRRVAVACSNCRERKIKCMHEAQQQCRRCKFNGLVCQYVETEKQRSRKNVPPRTRTRARTSAQASPVTPGLNFGSERGLEGVSAGAFDTSALVSPPTTPNDQYIFSVPPTQGAHPDIYLDAQYTLSHYPPASHVSTMATHPHTHPHTHIHGIPSQNVQTGMQADMYSTAASFNFDISTAYPMDYGDDGWVDYTASGCSDSQGYTSWSEIDSSQGYYCVCTPDADAEGDFGEYGCSPGSSGECGWSPSSECEACYCVSAPDTDEALFF
ncbi:hypothetical protein B0H19DRAFT_1233932 [Mycena capillaripes]|nr:hypothetical protein B0H19DRAFT_1233932 [Mycena capillaripes]